MKVLIKIRNYTGFMLFIAWGILPFFHKYIPQTIFMFFQILGLTVIAFAAGYLYNTPSVKSVLKPKPKTKRKGEPEKNITIDGIPIRQQAFSTRKALPDEIFNSKMSRY